ncbi:hypothetical protein ACNRC9_11050 [Ralstonia pseudosolanacearum]|uniref:hypothetical protein n=1 Tax=Ralstonia pseudosolanacearum TaxID=1310165 RepID=UPI003AAB367D
MKTLEYSATAYRQALNPDAPWLISFVAPAEEVHTWAGIPRKTDNTLTGFQRPDEEPRVLKAKDYFSQFTTNQSPTSLVLGIHQQSNGKRLVDLQFEDQDEDKSVRSCKLIITLDEDEPLADAVERLKAQIRSRIAYTNDIENDVELLEDNQGEEATTEDADSDFFDNEEIELGKSLLQNLLIKLDDPLWCKDNETHLRDLAKPATIIDGQHRILGAKLCERGIPFSIIGIYNCSWAEQVFQFTVVNYTAKGIPDQFITANAALSLTADELQGLESRLQQAGVKVIEYELMRAINFDQNSPFKDLVNLTPRKKDNLIGYKTMVQIGKAWYAGRDNAVRQIIDHLYPDIPGRTNAKNRLEQWKDEHWGYFFQDFWNVVYSQYLGKKTEDGDILWSVGNSNLMVAVVLQQLQAQFLTNLTAQDESFFEVADSDTLEAMRAKIRKRAQTFIGYFPADFFGKKWKMSSLNIGPGREALNYVFRQLADTKGAFQWKSSGLVTGKAA